MIYLHLNSWAGRTRYRVEIVKRTSKRLQIRLLDDCPLKGRIAGDEMLVPPSSVWEEETATDVQQQCRHRQTGEV